MKFWQYIKYIFYRSILWINDKKPEPVTTSKRPNLEGKKIKYDFSKKDLRRGVYIKASSVSEHVLCITHVYTNVKSRQVEAVSTDLMAKKILISLKQIDYIFIDKNDVNTAKKQ